MCAGGHGVAGACVLPAAVALPLHRPPLLLLLQTGPAIHGESVTAAPEDGVRPATSVPAGVRGHRAGGGAAVGEDAGMSGVGGVAGRPVLQSAGRRAGGAGRGSVSRVQ